MITQGDIEELVYDLLRPYGVSIFLGGGLPTEEVAEERAVVIVGAITNTTYFMHTPVNVNWCVPDIGDKADLLRLKEVEHLLLGLGRGCVTKNGVTVHYYRESMERGADRNLKMHYVNLKLMVEQINTIENGKG